jgi:hypothetical protein
MDKSGWSSRSTREAAGNANGRSFSDCDDFGPIGYPAAPAPGTRADDECPRKYAPATLRNRDFILGVLRDVLPTKGVILEIASGSGEHVVYFARSLPSLIFQPSDREPDALQSVAAWVKATRVTNVRAPMVLDVSQSPWPIAAADGIICINMVHISPWEATLGLIRGAAAILPPTAAFYLYGPFKREGFATTPSNQAFDRSLRDRNPTWGLRDLEAVAAIAQSVGFSVPAITEMPANNLAWCSTGCRHARQDEVHDLGASLSPCLSWCSSSMSASAVMSASSNAPCRSSLSLLSSTSRSHIEVSDLLAPGKSCANKTCVQMYRSSA